MYKRQVYESKEGRKAIYAKIVIDATGDGDIYSRANAPFMSMSDQVTRANTTALVWRIGGVDGNAYFEWQQNHPDQMCIRDRCNTILKARLGRRTASTFLTSLSK